MRNFNNIGALVFEKSCPPTSKIQFWTIFLRNPNGRRFQKSLCPRILLPLTWTLGKYSYIKNDERNQFFKVSNPCNPLTRIILQTLLAAWEAGELKNNYLNNWLTETGRELSRLEEAAAPPGWNCQWDRYCISRINTHKIESGFTHLCIPNFL